MRERSVSKAAQKMFITQSAMSHVLHRLRQQLDDPVLVKTSHGMQPTERSLALIDPISKLLRSTEQLLTPPAHFEPASSQRRFVLAATDYLELLLIPPLINRIMSLAPGIDIHVQRTGPSFPVDSLESNSIDMVLGFEVVLSPPAQFTYSRLFDDKMACLVRKDHPLANEQPFDLEKYLTANHLLISRTGSNLGLIDAWLAKKQLDRRIGLIVPHFLSAPLIVAQTDLVLSLPLRVAQQFKSFAPLKILPLPIELPNFNLIMIWHPLRDKDPGHAWLRSQILSLCRTFPPALNPI